MGLLLLRFNLLSNIRIRGDLIDYVHITNLKKAFFSSMNFATLYGK